MTVFYAYRHYELDSRIFQGVLEAIRISCAGFPTRRTFDEFNARFSTLAPDVLNGR